MLKSHKNKGFTLLEILIVIVIISTLISIVSVSINSLKPNPATMFLEKLKINIASSKNFAKIYNKNTKLSFDFEKQIANFYVFDNDKDIWIINNKINALSFKDLSVNSDLANINIKSNGFVDFATISIDDLNLETK